MRRDNQPAARTGYYPDGGAKSKGGRGRRVNRVRLALMLVSAAVFVFCAVKLVSYFGDIARAKSGAASLREIYSEAEPSPVPALSPQPTDAPRLIAAEDESKPTGTPAAAIATAAEATPAPSAAKELWSATYKNNPLLRISERFLDLLEQNGDIVGWLTIDGLVDEPVMQKDNKYYLTHDVKKRKSVTGALFLDESCNLRTADPQLLIHGHNMKEGAMFGSLKKYKVKDASFYREHPFITFNTIYEDAQYVIFAVLECDTRPSESDYLPFWTTPRFASAEVFDKYIRDARSLSHFKSEVDVRAGDRLLTLATCLGDDDNKRLVIMARAIRENEDMLTLRTGIIQSVNR